MLFWIICGLIIYASTIGYVNKRMGVELPMDENNILMMLTFAVLGPVSVVLGSIILNDINNK